MAAESDWRNDIPAEDRPVVDAIKERMKQEGLAITNPKLNNDVYIARFSRARDRKVDAAYEMLKNALTWRQETKVDTVNEWFGASDLGKRCIAYYPAQDYGFSPEGHPVLLDHFPLSDPNAVVAAFGVDEVINFHIWAMERLMDRCIEASDRLKRPVTDIIFVFNMDGLQWKHMGGSALSLIKPTFQIDADYYPETVAAVYVINAPRLFSILYRLASPFVDPKTLQKVKIFGSDWLKEVAKSEPSLPPDNFPVSWGGSGGDTWLRMGGSSIGGSSENDSVTTTLSIAAGDSTTVTIEVEKDNSSILWEFTLPAYDIEFSLEKVEKKGNEVLEEPSRMSSDPDPCQGMREKLQKGTYQFVFNNKYSWATSKTVNLTYSVSAPLSKSQKKKKKKGKKK